MLPAFAILLAFQCLGEGLVFLFHLPVPGPVAGMLLLFATLVAWPRLHDTVEKGANELLRHLSLLFVPAGVGVMIHLSLVEREWLPIAAALIGSAVITVAVTALVLQLLSRWLRGAGEKE